MLARTRSCRFPPATRHIFHFSAQSPAGHRAVQVAWSRFSDNSPVVVARVTLTLTAAAAAAAVAREVLCGLPKVSIRCRRRLRVLAASLALLTVARPRAN